MSDDSEQEDYEPWSDDDDDEQQQAPARPAAPGHTAASPVP